MEQAVEQPELQQPSDHLLRDGLILAVVIPILGVVWACRLFVKDRLSEAFFVLMTALAVIAIYVVLFVPFGSGSAYSAYQPAIRTEVEETIRSRIKQHDETSLSSEELTLNELSCVAQSSSVMKCLAEVSTIGFNASKAQAIYEVTIDQSNGHFIIGQPQVHQTEESTP